MGRRRALTLHQAGRAMHILLVEDNPADVRLTREALSGSAVPHRLTVALDGEDAMRVLRRQTPHESAQRPDLILLDLNLPKKDGREVLAEVKGDDDLRRIPVCVLSTSDAETDVQRCYDLHANAYATKPIRVQEYAFVVQKIQEFWYRVAEASTL